MNQDENKTKRISIIISDDDLMKIKTLKTDFNVNMSGLVRLAIRNEYDKRVVDDA